MIILDEKEQRELRERLERLKKEKGAQGTVVQHDVDANAAARPAEQVQHQPKKSLVDNRYVFIGIVAGILVLTVVMRVGLLKYVGFFEPDGFFHYTVIMEAIANHYVIPMNQSLSGFPLHNEITEPGGLYLVTLIPYALLHGFGVSAYTIMRYIPILFGILDAIGVYFLTKYLSNSRVAGLLAMFFMSISSGDISRTAALVYRGDSFATIFVIVALIFFVKSLTTARKGYYKYIYAAVSGVVLATAEAIWGGAPFGVVIYIFAILMLAVYGFVKADSRMAKGSLLLLGALFLSYLVQWLYVVTTILRYVPTLGGASFFVIYIPLLAGCLLAWYITTRKSRLASMLDTWAKRLGITLGIMAVAGLAMALLFPVLISGLISAGRASGNLGVTIQELQPPTFSFIWDSFSYQIMLAPAGVVAYLILRSRLHSKESIRNADIAFMVVAAYFIVTLYLQLGAIRYNSLVSAPIAIFAGYCVYSVPRFFYYRRRLHKYIAFGIMGLFTAFIVLNVVQTAANSFSSGQADGINPQFLQAMAWMYNNTPSNATVLALWPDGSVVEGWAHRQSYMDSVNGQTVSKIYNFSRWLFSETPDPQYLINASRPQYFLVRGYWLAELGGIATEGNITNTTPFGYEAVSSLHISEQGNYSYYLFNTSIPPYYNIEIEEEHNANGSENFQASLGTPQSTQRAPLRYIIFINDSGGPYSVARSTLNDALNYSIVVDYAGANITGGALVGSGMPESNFFTFVFLCNPSYCPYDADNITMQVVYQNEDSKIIKINYG